MPATEREYQEISEDYSALRKELEVLFKVGTDKPLVKGLLREANNALEARDYQLAQRKIAEAQRTARRATANFLTAFVMEMRNILLSVRTIGGDISMSRPMLIKAKDAVANGKYKRAVALAYGTVDATGGLTEEYRETLKVLVKVRYNYVLAETIGLDMTWSHDLLNLAFSELKQGNHKKAIEHADNAKSEIRRINADHKRAMEHLWDSREAIEEGRRKGIDVTQAEVLMAKVMERLKANDTRGATELLVKTMDTMAEQATPPPEPDGDVADQLYLKFDKARTQLAYVSHLGVEAKEAEEKLERAEEAFTDKNYGMADDLLDQTLAIIPNLIKDKVRAGIEDMGSMIKEAHRDGHHVEAQRELLSEATHQSARGDFQGALGRLGDIQVQVLTIRSHQRAKEVIDRGRTMGADMSDAEMNYAMGLKRQSDGEWERALAYYSDAIDEAIKAGKAITWQGDGQ